MSAAIFIVPNTLTVFPTWPYLQCLMFVGKIAAVTLKTFSDCFHYGEIKPKRSRSGNIFSLINEDQRLQIQHKILLNR